MTMHSLIFLIAIAAMQADAQQGPADPRIQLLSYNADQVVTLPVAPGYAAVVELSADERIDNVVVGNSAVWQITETSRGDRVIVKPLGGAVPTNMVVMTDARRYVFLLDPSSSDGQTSFVLRFSYPQAVMQEQASATPIATYKVRGAKALLPVAMRDDGKRTTVSWAKQTPLPAIFAIDGGHETIVNGRMAGNDYVIEGTAARYVLRAGTAEAVAVRRLVKPRR